MFLYIYITLDDPSEEFFAKEGKITLQKHRLKERSAKLIKAFKERLTSYECIMCGFNFERVYGELGKGFIEAHHTKPVAKMEDEIVNTKDLIPVCSNCHSMLHRKNSPQDWQQMKKIFDR